MAFPVNGILDTFDRADNTTLGTNWSGLNGTTLKYGIASNLAYNTTLSTYVGEYWNPATFGPDCESYITLTTKNTASSNDNSAIFARTEQEGAGGTWDAYDVSPNVDSNVVRIERTDNAVTTLLGATISQTITSGDKFGIQCVGSTITAYYNTAGSWVSIGSRTDATYGAAGHLAMYIPGNTNNGRWNDFGGGTLASTSIKTINGLAKASVKTITGLATASVKTWQGLA